MNEFEVGSMGKFLMNKLLELYLNAEVASVVNRTVIKGF